MLCYLQWWHLGFGFSKPGMGGSDRMPGCVPDSQDGSGKWRETRNNQWQSESAVTAGVARWHQSCLPTHYRSYGGSGSMIGTPGGHVGLKSAQAAEAEAKTRKTAVHGSLKWCRTNNQLGLECWTWNDLSRMPSETVKKSD